MTTHDALVDAVHVQSRVVVTVIVPAAPAAGTDDIEFSVERLHFDVEGPITETEDDPHALPMRASASAAANAARSRPGITAAAGCNSSASMPAVAARARPFLEPVICEEIRALQKCSAAAPARRW